MKECLIVGNGASRNRLSDRALARVPSFGMNFCNFQPTYFVCVDQHVLLEHVADLYDHAALADIAYLSVLQRGTSKLYELPNVRLIEKDDRSFRAERFLSGLTASYVALKMAYYAGFELVHLWGVDHTAAWDHYREDYPRDSDHRVPSAEMRKIMEWHYQLAANVYARAGRLILNHSDPSRLDMIFRRTNEC
jgi:hypothetical protein